MAKFERRVQIKTFYQFGFVLKHYASYQSLQVFFS